MTLSFHLYHQPQRVMKPNHHHKMDITTNLRGLPTAVNLKIQILDTNKIYLKIHVIPECTSCQESQITYTTRAYVSRDQWKGSSLKTKHMCHHREMKMDEACNATSLAPLFYNRKGFDFKDLIIVESYIIDNSRQKKL